MGGRPVEFGSTDRRAGQPAKLVTLATLSPFHARNGFEDARERAAAADVAVEALLDLFGRRVRMLLEQADARHDEARRAEAAHQRVLVAERLLHRMQLVAVGEAVDGANLLALHLDRQRRAGVDRAAVDDHRAGAAGAAIAAALVAGEIGAHAQRVEQRDARLDHQIDLPAVHVQAHRHVAGPDGRRRALRLSFLGRDDGLGQTDNACGSEKIATVKPQAVRASRPS